MTAATVVDTLTLNGNCRGSTYYGATHRLCPVEWNHGSWHRCTCACHATCDVCQLPATPVTLGAVAYCRPCAWEVVAAGLVGLLARVHYDGSAGPSDGAR